MNQQNQSPVVSDAILVLLDEIKGDCSEHSRITKCVSAIETLLIEAALPSGVRVKALEWGLSGNVWEAETPWGKYAFDHTDFAYFGGAVLWLASDRVFDDVVHQDEEQAKAAAQADYERRVLSAIEPTQAPQDGIANAVLAWMVKYDLLDADNEYQAADVIAVLDELAPQPSHAETVAPYAAAPAPDELEVVAHIVEGGDLRWVQFSDQLSDADKDLASVHPLVRLTDAQAAIAAKDGGWERAWLEQKRAEASEARVAELEKALEEIASQESPELLPGSHLSMQNRGQLAFAMIEAIVRTARAALHPEREG